MDDVLAIAEALAKPFEGLHRLGTDGLVYPYHDPVGFPTIGYGRLLSRERFAALDRWPPITVEQAEEWLAADLAKALRSVLRLVRNPDLAEHQLAALVDFAFNCGAGNLEASTLLRKIRRGDLEGAADEFPRWVFAAGVKLPGLVRRRQAERAVWLR